MRLYSRVMKLLTWGGLLPVEDRLREVDGPLPVERDASCTVDNDLPYVYRNLLNTMKQLGMTEW